MKKSILTKKISSIRAAFLISNVFLLNAARSFAIDADQIENPIPSATSLSAFFAAIVDVLIQMGVVVSALGIMYGGFLLVTAQGDMEKIQAGRKTITWALIGTAVLLGAKVIFVAIKGTVEQLK